MKHQKPPLAPIGKTQQAFAQGLLGFANRGKTQQAFAQGNLAGFQFLASQGDVVRMPALQRIYFINDPDSIQRILVDHVENYSKHRTTYSRMAKIMGLGLLTDDGPSWQQRRRLLQPLFKRNFLEQYYPLMLDQCQHLIRQWKQHREKNQPVNASYDSMVLALNLASTLFFRQTFTKKVSQRFIRYVHICNHYVARSPTVWRWYPSIYNCRFRITSPKLDNLLLTLQQTAIRQPSTEPPPLIKIWHDAWQQQNAEGSMRAFLAETKNLFIPGHETTGNALAFALYNLAQHEEVYDKLRSEIKQHLGNTPPTSQQLKQLPYLNAVIQETLRLYPPIWVFERRVLADDSLAGYRIPANARILVSIHTLHRHPHYWESPDRFDPSRFLNDEPRPARPKGAFIPFNTGPHACIGQQLALLSLRLALVMIVQEFALNLKQTKPILPNTLISLKPDRAIQLLLD